MNDVNGVLDNWRGDVEHLLVIIKVKNQAFTATVSASLLFY